MLSQSVFLSTAIAMGTCPTSWHWRRFIADSQNRPVRQECVESFRDCPADHIMVEFPLDDGLPSYYVCRPITHTTAKGGK